MFKIAKRKKKENVTPVPQVLIDELLSDDSLSDISALDSSDEYEYHKGSDSSDFENDTNADDTADDTADDDAGKKLHLQ